MESKVDVKNWYNTFSDKQVATGINLRHYTIFDKLVDSGLKKNHRVLEIGCGVGTLTELIYTYIRKGEIVATDISNESVEIAKSRMSNSDKIEFVVSDMKNFSYPKQFDFVVFPDVLEHIPVEQHQALFETAYNHMHDKSVILINIPHPKALDYIRATTPEKLQIIDQAISANTMIQNAHAANLELIEYKSYSLFNEENDSIFISFKKDNDITLKPLSKSTIIKRKLVKRIKYYLAKGIF